MILLALALPLAMFGCSSGAGDNPPAARPEQTASKPAEPQAEEAKYRAALAKQDREDRNLAEAQKYCAVETENRLGSMGKPFKLEIDGQPVFLCCQGCKKRALAAPDKTLATVKELRAKSATSK